MALESKSEKPPGELAPLPPGDSDPDDDSSAGRMSFLDHLDELRKRLVRTVLGILAGFLIAFAFIKYIFEFIMVPFNRCSQRVEDSSTLNRLKLSSST